MIFTAKNKYKNDSGKRTYPLHTLMIFQNKALYWSNRNHFKEGSSLSENISMYNISSKYLKDCDLRIEEREADG